MPQNANEGFIQEILMGPAVIVADVSRAVLVNKYRNHTKTLSLAAASNTAITTSSSNAPPPFSSSSQERFLEYDDLDDHINTVNDDIELHNEEAYLVRIAGNTSGLNYRNRRIKIDKFVEGKFISACVPAAIHHNNKIIQTEWPTDYLRVIASDGIYHHSVIVLLNLKPRCSTTKNPAINVGICTCREIRFANRLRIFSQMFTVE